MSVLPASPSVGINNAASSASVLVLIFCDSVLIRSNETGYRESQLTQGQKKMPSHSEPSGDGQSISYQMDHAPIPTITEAIEAHPEIRSIAPACELLPRRSPTQIRELCRSIAETGQAHPINVDSSGALLNGRHRLLACHMLGIRAATTAVTAESSIDYVLANRHQSSYGAATLNQIALNLQTMITKCGSLKADTHAPVPLTSRFKDDTAIHLQGQTPLVVFRGECVRDAARNVSTTLRQLSDST